MRKELIREWVETLLVTGVVFTAFSLYLFLRRGYYNLYIVNKVLGSTAVILAGLTLILGPLARTSDRFDRFVVLRKSLGLTALGLALAHSLASTLFLSHRFPLSWYQKEWLPISFGALALLIWLYLARISRVSAIKKLGSAVWRSRQSLGAKIAFIAIFLHLVLMKYPGWIRWWQGQVKPSFELANPGYPPASLFVFLIMLAILLYRKFFLG